MMDAAEEKSAKKSSSCPCSASQALVMSGGFAWEPEVEAFRAHTLKFVEKFLKGVMKLIRDSGGEGKLKTVVCVAP